MSQTLRKATHQIPTRNKHMKSIMPKKKFPNHHQALEKQRAIYISDVQQVQRPWK
jgi:hypothetical protein